MPRYTRRVSKQWKPGKKTVELPSDAPRPSRIRREPARIEAKAAPKPRNRERELWLGGAGIVAMAAACAALVVGVSAVTSRYSASAAATAETEERFRHCYIASGRDCVLDGDTIFLNGAKVEISVDAPEIRGARCSEERSRGIESANRLRELLNKGNVTVSAARGEMARDVQVDGDDIAAAMIAAGAARDYRAEHNGWCG